MTLAKDGWKEMLVLSIVFGGMTVAGVLWCRPAAIVGAVLWACGLLFFRDPARRVPADESLILSPADGKVTAVQRVEQDAVYGGPVWRISIFLSVFNVHVNRAPYAGRVVHLSHKSGGFKNAMSPDSSELNESNTMIVEPANGLAGPLYVKQIAGLIARRIVCRAQVGDHLQAGQRFGLIKFGSRTDMTLAISEEVSIEVRVGDKVRAGTSVIARVSVPTKDVQHADER